MFRRILIVSLAILFAIDLSAQTHTLTGTIVDQQAKTPLAGATVRISSIHDSTFRINSVTDSLGKFTFSNLAKDTFQLSISFVGYNPVSQMVRIDTTDLNIHISAVPNTSQELATVIVTVNISPVTQKGDTVQINASQYKVNPDASGEDLVKKMPGITIENGQVKAHGENVQKVTIDGRDLFGDDATAALRNLPAEVIDKIQIFDRLSDQAQFTGFDDGNTTKAINVVTKVNMRNGQFGRVFAGYGTDNRYNIGGNATIFKGNERISIVGLVNNINQQNFSQQDLLGVTSNAQRGGGGGGPRGGGGGPRGGSGNRGSGGGNQGGGNFGGFGNNANFLVGQQNGINQTNSFGINYSNILSPKVTLSGSYFFNNTQNTTNEISNVQYFSTKLPNRADTTYSTSNNINHRVNLRLEYKIDSFNQLIVIPNLGFQNNRTDRIRVSNSMFSSGVESNITRNSSTAHTWGNNLNNTLLFRHAFHKRGRTISFNLNTSYNERNGNTYADADQRFYDSTGVFAADSILKQNTIQDNHGYQLSGNVAYTEPIGANSQLQLNYNPTYSKSMADQEAYRFDNTAGKYSVFDTLLSNKFNNTYQAQNGGIAYRYGNKDNQFSIGASYQHSLLTSDRSFPTALQVNKSFDNILPNAFARFKLSTRSSLRLFYRASINQPSVTQLQDVYDITNRPFITAGNPDLKPQYNNTLSTRYTFTNTAKGIVFVGNIFMQAANNYIANGTWVPVRDSMINNKFLIYSGEQLTKPVNMNGYLNLRSFLTFAIPVKFIKSNINFNGGVTYNKLPGILNNVNNISKTLTYTLGTVIGSNISQYVDFTVSYSANINNVKNETDPTLNDNYFQQTAGIFLNLLTKSGWFFQNDLNNQLYSGLTVGFNQNYTIWNISAGKKFFKDQKGELKLTVFDLLKQNRSITRNVTETYIEDVQNQVLKQYFMLTFTYNLRNFGSAPKASNNRNRSNRSFEGG
ncbi:MAG: outer membrane beta-barrel protein [Flavisolibacter sp.]